MRQSSNNENLTLVLKYQDLDLIEKVEVKLKQVEAD
jgi:hypothetical protein